MKKILIIGKSAKEYALAKKLSQSKEVDEVFTAPGNDAMAEFSTRLDIREESVAELLDFVMENAIDLTICPSQRGIKADIARIFQENNQLIFAPTAQSAKICTYKSCGKKFMYKLRIPSPKFGIFDKPQLALDYIKHANMPIVLKKDEYHGYLGTLVCNGYTPANSFVDNIFSEDETKILIEDFVYGHEFSFYVVTDGYHASPICSVANYKFSLDGEGGLLTSGVGSFVPNYKISNSAVDYIMSNIIFPTLEALEKSGTPYVGILGIDCVLTPDNQIVTLGYNSFLQEHDAQGVLEIIDENILDIIQACAIGSFADDYEKIKISDKFAVSCVLSCGKKSGEVIEGLDKLNDDTLVAHFNTRKNKYLEYETLDDRTLLVTRSAKTLTRAKEDLYEEIEQIKFNGKTHRHDICRVIYK